jgi:hypothetical protein
MGSNAWQVLAVLEAPGAGPSTELQVLAHLFDFVDAVEEIPATNLTAVSRAWQGAVGVRLRLPKHSECIPTKTSASACLHAKVLELLLCVLFIVKTECIA